MREPPALVVMAKAPVAGFVKTRLLPAMTAQRAADLAAHMLRHAIRQGLQGQASGDVSQVMLCASPDPAHADWTRWRSELSAEVHWFAQGEGDLGERMARAADHALSRASGGVMLVGTDCPELEAQHLKTAANALQTHDVAMLPALDGGYVLLGMRSPHSTLFANMPWSTNAVAQLTRERCTSAGLRLWQGVSLHDIDEPGDLAHLPVDWRHLIRGESA